MPEDHITRGGDVHARPRPRALALGIVGKEITRLQNAVFSTLDIVNAIHLVDQLEYDVLVTGEGVPPGAAPHLFVLAKDKVGAKSEPVDLGQVDRDDRLPCSIAFRSGSWSREFNRPDLPATLAALVEETLEPGVAARHPQRVLECSFSGYQVRNAVDCLRTKLQPLLVTTDGKAIAGRFERPGEAACWALPDFVFDLVPWAVEAVREWRSREPERFPGEPAWHESARWATAPELELMREGANLRAALELHQRELEGRIREAETHLIEARLAGNQSHRTLLTSQGNELVRAVADALRSIGFEVLDMDATERVERLKDLRVTDPAISDWVALVEVKGYARGGARASDLQRIETYRTVFATSRGHPPNAAWYVVNHSLVTVALSPAPPRCRPGAPSGLAQSWPQAGQ